MGLMEQIKLDIATITGNTNEFGVVLSFRAPTGETATVNGYYTDHSNAFDSDGMPVVGKVVSVAVSEQFLIDANYPTRTNQDLITMKDTIVEIVCSDGVTRTYKAQSWSPDYSINLIILHLSEYVS